MASTLYMKWYIINGYQDMGPISVAVYAPGTDFDEAVKTIIHLRNCVSKNVKDFVTFHLYFEAEHFPTNVINNSKINFLPICIIRKARCRTGRGSLSFVFY
ncbi:hypothetical protein Avbf_18679 [Armadillidium vulgare]|nr:hypothetical protein Avbf_18679 [Armadillidium vulgare]